MTPAPATATLSGGLEQLHRIAVGIFQLDLLASGTRFRPPLETLL
jgi:hypothetical protein